VHYYKFNIPAWSLSTAHLSLEEEAVYFRLVNFYYDTEQPIPIETQPVIRRLRLSGHEALVAQILSEYFTQTKKGFVHDRCEEILNEYAKTAGISRENGKKGGRPKKIKPLQETQPEPAGLLAGTQEKPGNNPNYKPLTINQELVTKNQEPQKQPSPWPGLTALKDIDFSKWPSLPTKETMDQWLKVRKNKKATNSQIAMDDVCAQIMEAHADGMTADNCIRQAVANSWAGFKYQWIKNQSQIGRAGGTRHNEFETRDYNAGVSNGTF
jgi:uncharacterized protein YdaU (DUF1376 family)